jgi:hypothetical protein
VRKLSESGGAEGGGEPWVQDVGYDFSDWMFEYAHRVRPVEPDAEWLAERYEREMRWANAGIDVQPRQFPELWVDFVPRTPKRDKPTSSSEEPSSESS